MPPGEWSELGNHSQGTEFILLGITDLRGLQLLLFTVLLPTYLLTLLGNLFIVVLSLVDSRLQTPMYYLLRNFSLLEMGFTSAITPQVLSHLLTGHKTISAPRCFSQMVLYFTLGTVEFFLLAVMSVDRYLAICYPLRYPALMTSQTCLGLVLGCWAGSFLFLSGPCIWLLLLPLCGPKVLNHFFCDSTPLLALACTDTRLLQLSAFLVAVCTLAGAVTVTVTSYLCIIWTLLQLSSAQSRRKAFSTCSSHMLVVSITYGSCIIMYLHPTQTGQLDLNKGVAFFNTIVAPLLNPFVYCLRNKLVQQVSRDVLVKGRGPSRHLRV
ncbi:olfactory receptor 49-like [Vombatus ursinus]|uniref:olfactory receptor 49-like n=1 Tax=Vombatus ursinus TaxID=29139 RepID=UPI000FFDBB24|nr:olfactory receptor 49-like [Vombatus ursinus]XP_027701753.1 olfactory receptor 49-like [Vombatus ursinus]